MKVKNKKLTPEERANKEMRLREKLGRSDGTGDIWKITRLVSGDGANST
jgi:hypothetical protein